MIEAILSLFGKDFGTTAATASILVFIVIAVGAGMNRSRLDISGLVVALLSGTGAISGLKSFCLSSRECWMHGRKAAGY
jgi:hypothetical protein